MHFEYCVTIWEDPKKSLLSTCHFEEKQLVIEHGDKLAAFFMKHHFHLKEQLTDKLWFFRLGYLTGIFLERNEISLSLQVKQLTLFLPEIKFKISSKNKNFEKLVSAINLAALQYLQTFLMSSVML